MKKLMFVAAAAAMTSAFAEGPVSAETAGKPLVYDYESTVRYVTVVPMNVADRNGTLRSVFVKQQKETKIKGYLIHDIHGATSKQVSTDEANNPFWTGLGLTTPVANNATIYNGTKSSKLDKFRNRAFLVVMNTGDIDDLPRAARLPKILPAVIDSKWVRIGPNAEDFYAEGNLFVGGEMVTAVRPRLYSKYDAVNSGYLTVEETAATAKAGKMYQDYGWTSSYLFGQFNGPQWDANKFWAISQAKIFAGMDAPFADDFTEWNYRGLQGKAFYHDTWMNHTGIGKAISDSTTPPGAVICCGMVVPAGSTVVKPYLESLSGYLKGGLFICSENGFETGTVSGRTYQPLDNQPWENQFFTAGLFNDFTTIGAPDGRVPNVLAFGTDTTVVAPYFYYDAAQDDIWQDGDIELNTTDVLGGTWWIKLYQGDYAGNHSWGTVADSQIPGMNQLKDAIWAAARALNPTCQVYSEQRGPQIASWAYLADQEETRFFTPMMSKDFYEYYLEGAR